MRAVREADPVKVIYIAGAGRSGSTVLGRVLGQVPGFLAAGELRYVWRRGLVEDRLCGCGRPFLQCPFWERVLQEGFGGPDGVDLPGALAAERAVARVRHLPAALAAGNDGHERSPVVEAHRRRLATLYRAIRAVSGCRAIVDSSKLPLYGHLLASVPGIDLHVVHLVRDPRATAFSWLRAKAQPDGLASGLMERRAAWKSALLWDVWNAAALALFSRHPGRYQRLRYEDFVARPQETVAAVLAGAGHPGEAPAFLDSHRIVLDAGHSPAGNPDRLRTGPTELRPDLGWVSGLSPSDRTLVTATTAPLLALFGYRLAVGPSPVPVT